MNSWRFVERLYIQIKNKVEWCSNKPLKPKSSFTFLLTVKAYLKFLVQLDLKPYTN